MAEYKVAEIFESINGEGRKAGQLAVFVRLCGCNLNCSYCDTRWANADDMDYELLDEEEIYQRILKSGIKNVTLTGGEPLLHADIGILLNKLADDGALNVEIETNGSISLTPFCRIENRPSFTMDYKLPSSAMEQYMLLDNFNRLTDRDTVKFVVADIKDLERAVQIINTFSLTEKCTVYFSPVFGTISPKKIVEFMKKYRLNGVNLQLQMHKIIWDPQKRGV